MWCKRKDVFPINHMFVVHESLTKDRPDVVSGIYRMLVESRELAPDTVKAGIPPVDLEANRKTLEMGLDAWQQHILPRRIAFDELFKTSQPRYTLKGAQASVTLSPAIRPMGIFAHALHAMHASQLPPVFVRPEHRAHWPVG